MDKYSKLKVLGKGSFGSAVLIKRKSDGQLLVVKEVNMVRMSSKEKQEARHEVRVLQQLKHPNITQFVEQFEKKGVLYIVMEYADGGDLHMKVEAAKRSRKLMKEELCFHYFAQLCLAMEYLHSRHILHRDIKAMNVFLTQSGVVKLGDFGISTVLRNTLGMANTVCGTPYYFSPELCRNKPYNNKSDVWALGIIFYELLTLRHAFDGSSMQQLLQRIVKGNYSSIPQSISKGARDIVTMCLQKDPSKRPTIKQILNLDAMRGALAKLQGDLCTAEIAQKPLKEVVAVAEEEEGESERILKAKIAGAKAAAAVAPKPPPPPSGSPVFPGGIQRQQLYEQARQQQQRGVSPSAAKPVDVKQEMNKIDNFIAHLGRPTNEVAREALAREKEAQLRREEKARELEKIRQKERVRMQQELQERQKREKERQKAAQVKAKAHQAELERVMNDHKERLRVNQEREKKRREDLKRKQEKGVHDKDKDKDKREKRRVVPQSPREEPAKQPFQRRSPAAELVPPPRPQVEKVQKWADRENERKRKEIESARQRKLQEERLAVLEMDMQVHKAQRRQTEQQLQHRIVDPELEAWVKRREQEKKGQQPISARRNVDVASKAEVRRSIDAMDRVLRQQHGQPSKPAKLAANACGSPEVRKFDHKAHPLGRQPHQPPVSAALFPPIQKPGVDMRRAYSHDASMDVPPEEDERVPTPFVERPKLQRSHHRSLSDVTGEYELHHKHEHIPRIGDRRGVAGMQQMQLKPEELAVAQRRDVSAPPVMRTPNKHIDASTPILELEAVSKMEDVPTPVRQWMDMEPPEENRLQPPSTTASAGAAPSSDTHSTAKTPESAGQTLTPPAGDKKSAPVLGEDSGLIEDEAEEVEEDLDQAPDVDDDVVEESILEAANTATAMHLRSQQYHDMQSHITTLLASRPHHRQEETANPLEAAAPSAIAREPSTDIIETTAELKGEDEESPRTPTPSDDEDFGDAEAITPGHFNKQVQEDEDEIPSEDEELSAVEEAETVPSPLELIPEMTETALQRVAAICGEGFRGTQPCKTDGRPLFDTNAVGQVSLAELLREYLERVLGIDKLTAVYNIIGELLQPEPSPPSLPKKETSGANHRSGSVGSGKSSSHEGSQEGDREKAPQQPHQQSVIRRATEIVVDHFGTEGETDEDGEEVVADANHNEALIDETLSLVGQLVYFDAEAFSC